MTEYTPLDSLKELYWVATNLIDVVQEMLAAGFDHDPDDTHDADPILESVKGEFVKALARHVPGLRMGASGLVEYAGPATILMHQYQDGSPISIPLTSENGWVVQDYYPRRDGSRWAFEARLEQMGEEREAAAREYERQHQEG